MTDVTEASDPYMAKRMPAIEFARGSIANLAPERNLADELIADRRAEQATLDTPQRGDDDQ